MNSVGNLLKEKRESMNLSVDDIASKTRVQKKYIEAIEVGDFSFFQGQSFYQQVFMGSYADIVGLNKNDLLEQLVRDKEEFEVFSKKSPVANKNYELEQTREANVAEEPSVSEIATHETEVKNEEETLAQPDEVEEEVFVQPETSIVEEEILVQPELTNDVEEVVEEEAVLIEEPVAEVLEDVEEEKSPYPVPKIFDKYLHDVDVDSLIASEKTNEETLEVSEPEKMDEEITLDSIFEDETSEDDVNDDINKLIEQLNQDFSSGADSDVAVDADEAESLDKEVDVETLNSSILDDIKKINDDTTIDESFEQKVIDSIDYEVKNPSVYAKEPAIESTAVIDITSGIELEKIPSQRVETALEEDASLKLDDLFAEKEEASEDVTTQEKLIKELEDTLENKDLFNNLQDAIDPDKTSMDLRVAQALGDAKESVDEEIAKEKKRFSTLDYLLIIVFVVLVIVLGYIAFQYLNLG